jgi:hypothetical protein
MRFNHVALLVTDSIDSLPRPLLASVRLNGKSIPKEHPNDYADQQRQPEGRPPGAPHRAHRWAVCGLDECAHPSATLRTGFRRRPLI